ncbi:MAG TPA: MFS transporter, partial [Gammaproteobacteria bacterium]|nr:MFS transporter [Gammaproteobacteria bacterium]
FATALNISVCNLGIALGAVIGGWMVARYGIRAIGFGSAGIALCALALAMGLRGSASIPRLTET